MEKKKVKVTATISAIAVVYEDEVGNQELDFIDEIIEVEDFEVIRELD